MSRIISDEKEHESQNETQKDKTALLEVVIPILILMPIYYFDHSLASMGLLLVAFWLFYFSILFRGRFTNLGIRITDIRSSFVSTRFLFALGIFVVFPVSILIESQLPPLNGFSSSFSENPLSYIYYALIISPIIEEFVFRGVLQNRLSWYLPNYIANGLTSLAFVMIHWVSGEFWVISIIMILRFIRSMLYGHVFTKTQNIVHSWTIHVVFNLYEPVIVLVLMISGFVIV